MSQTQTQAPRTAQSRSDERTIRLHRVLAAPPERVYRAFLEPEAKARWLPPNGFTGCVHESQAHEGGRYRMSFTNFSTRTRTSFSGVYRELVPNERLRYVDTFDDPNLPGEIEVTVVLKAVPSGTELHIVQAGLPQALPLDSCYLGWQESLRSLARLVEPQFPD